MKTTFAVGSILRQRQVRTDWSTHFVYRVQQDGRTVISMVGGDSTGNPELRVFNKVGA